MSQLVAITIHGKTAFALQCEECKMVIQNAESAIVVWDGTPSMTPQTTTLLCDKCEEKIERAGKHLECTQELDVIWWFVMWNCGVSLERAQTKAGIMEDFI